VKGNIDGIGELKGKAVPIIIYKAIPHFAAK